MPPSSLSFQDLKAQAYATKDSLKRSDPSSIFNREKKDRKKSDWLKQNKGVNKRALRDVELRDEALDRRSHEAIVANMAKKAKQYDKLKRGLHGGLSEAQLAETTVDWDAKAEEHHYSSGSDDVDESLTVPRRDGDEGDISENDPVVEYVDELGRTRSARRSEIPRELLPKGALGDDEDDDGIVVENAYNYFPTYQQTEERLKEIDESLKEEDLEQHYDPRRNIRDHGAANYQFSASAEQRARERAELDKRREETQKARAETGAVDIKPGMEGMQADDSGLRSLALEKRKRELEERRKALQAKRRKVIGGQSAPESAAGIPPAPVKEAKGPVDPFDALEANMTSHNKSQDSRTTDVDAFLNDIAANVARR